MSSVMPWGCRWRTPSANRRLAPSASDLVAEDAAGNPVVIENQLGKTDHDHLGKLLTYMVTVGAKTAIWVAAEPRSEHVSTVAWLNESSAASFYLLKIEAIRIGDSLTGASAHPGGRPQCGGESRGHHRRKS